MVLADREWNLLSGASGESTALEELFTLDYVVHQLMEWGTQVLGHFILKGQGLETWLFDEVMGLHRRKSADEFICLTKAITPHDTQDVFIW